MTFYLEQWNSLVPEARGLGIRAQVRTPAEWNWSSEESYRRVQRLRQQIAEARSRREGGLVDQQPGTRDPSMMTVEECWREFNSLVPGALRRGAPRRSCRATPIVWRGSREHSQQRLRWIRSFFDGQSSTTPRMTPTLSAVSVQTFSETVSPIVLLPLSAEEVSFGVELEVNHSVTRQELAAMIADHGVPCQVEMYGHSTPQGRWKIVSDASVPSGSEVVSPPLYGEEGLAQVAKVCEAMIEAGCTVSRNCGFHVHVGGRRQPVSFFRNLALLYKHFEAAIDSIMAPSRRGSSNPFCQPVRVRSEQNLASARTVDEVAMALGQLPGLRNVRSAERYRKLNLMSFWQVGTVEFRQHQGTVDGQKAANWVRLCVLLASKASKVEAVDLPADASLASLLSVVEASDEVRNFFVDRQAFFARRDQRQAA